MSRDFIRFICGGRGVDPHGGHLSDGINSLLRIKIECWNDLGVMTGDLDFTLAPHISNTAQSYRFKLQDLKIQSTANGPVYLLLF